MTKELLTVEEFLEEPYGFITVSRTHDEQGTRGDYWLYVIEHEGEYYEYCHYDRYSDVEEYAYDAGAAAIGFRHLPNYKEEQ